MRLADSLEEQAALELLLEASKPPLPPAVRRLHYLLATPFRYRPHLGSRFRAAFDAGVWYGAEALRTALAEKSYWRPSFLVGSSGRTGPTAEAPSPRPARGAPAPAPRPTPPARAREPAGGGARATEPGAP